MDLKKFTIDFGIIGIASILCSFSGLILVPVFTKILGVESYGLWILTFTTITLIKPLANFSLPQALNRFIPGETDKSKIREAFYSTLVITICAGLLLYGFFIVFSGQIADLLFGGNRAIVILIAVFIPIWYVFLVCQESFRAFRQMKKYSIFMIVDAYGKVGVASFLILSGYGLYSVLISYLIIKVILLLAALIVIIRNIGISFPKFTEIKKYLKFSVPLLPGSLSGWFVHSSDRYMIAFFLGTIAVGYYNPAYSLGFLIFGLANIFAFILPPTLSEAYDNGRINEVKTYLSYATKYYTAIAIPFIVGTALLSKQIITILSTEKIAAEGWLVAPILALGTVILGYSLFFSQIIRLTKKTKIFGLAGIIAAGSNFVLNIFLIPIIGIVGAALTTCLAFILQTVIVKHYASKDIKFEIDKRFIFKVIASSITMSFVIFIWNPYGLFSVSGCIISCVILYFSLLLLMKGFSSEEVKFFKDIVKRAT